MPDGRSRNETTASAVEHDLWLFEMPHTPRPDDAQCRAIAARLLRHVPVRSVTIDHHARKALVRVKPQPTDNVCFEALRSEFTPIALSTGQANTAPMPAVVSWTDAASQSTCYIKLPTPAHGWRKALLLAAAGGTLLLGLLGVVLPGLPTTPFVLLASYCLLRSSPRLHERLLMSRLFGGVLRDWHVHRGLRPHVRYKAMAVVAIVLGLSLWLTTLPWIAKLVIVTIAACGVAYVWQLPVISEPPFDDSCSPELEESTN